MKLTKNKTLDIFLLVIASFLLLTAAIWNGYPIVYPDTGTYLFSGFTPETPFDRPITYGLFLAGTSLFGLSIWIAVFCQALMTVFVIYSCIRHFITSIDTAKWTFFVVTILTFTTGITWTVGQLIADWTTPLSILTLLLLLFVPELPRRERKTLFCVFFLMNASHISNVLLNSVLLAAAVVLCFFYRKSTAFSLNIKRIGWLIFTCWLGILTMNTAISKSSHVFRMGSLSDKGILKAYLQDNCTDTSASPLCVLKDAAPLPFDVFVWDEKASPLYKIGWKESKPEFKRLIWATYTTPKYMKMHLESAFSATQKQLLRFDMGEGFTPFDASTNVVRRIKQYLPKDTTALYASRQFQNNDRPKVIAVNHFFNWTMGVFSLFLASFFLFLFKKIPLALRYFCLFALLGIGINDFMGATFVYPADRFGCRVMWLVPLSCLLLMVYFGAKSRKKN
jgi:Cobalt transport protein